MDDNHLTHATWNCQYHVVFGSKYRTKRLYGDLRLELRDLFVRLSLQKGCRIEEGHLMPDHVHMLISISPKYSVAHIVGFLKGKTALTLPINMQRSANIAVITFGREDTSFRPSVTMNRSLDVISAIRRRPTRLQTMPTFLRALTST